MSANRTALGALLLALPLALSLALSLALLGGCADDAAEPPPGPAPVVIDYEAIVEAEIPNLLDGSLRDDSRARVLELGKPVALALLARLDHEEPVARWEIANLLGQLRDPRAIPALVDRALTDVQEEVRRRCMWAIAEQGKPELALTELRARLGDEEADPRVRWNAALALAELGADDGLELIHQGLDDPRRRLAALAALTEIGDEESVRTIQEVLSQLDTIQREQAVMALARIQSPRSTEVLIGMLRDAEPEVRWRACFGLGLVQDIRATAALEAVAVTEEDEQVQKHIRLALSKIRRRSPPASER